MSLTIALDTTRFALLAAVIGYAAYYDYKVGEVRNKIWIYGFFGLSLTFLSIYLNPETVALSLFSMGAMAVLSLVLFYVRGWGGADAKAFLTIAASMPTIPFGLQSPTVIYPLTVLLIASTFSLVSVLRQKDTPWLKRQVRFLPYTLPCLFIALLI